MQYTNTCKTVKTVIRSYSLNLLNLAFVDMTGTL